MFLVSNTNILTQFGMQSTRTSLETSAPFLYAIFFFFLQAVSYCGSSSKLPISKTFYCYFNPLLFFSFAWHFFHSLFFHCAEYFSGIRLQQPFHFWRIRGWQIMRLSSWYVNDVTLYWWLSGFWTWVKMLYMVIIILSHWLSIIKLSMKSLVNMVWNSYVN